VAADIKAYLRGVMSACRRGLPAEYVTARSLAVQQRLLGSASYATASTLVLYAAKDNEICTDLLLTEAVAAGRRVLFPKLERTTRELILIPVTRPAELAPGAFGLREPIGTETVPVAALCEALICVPGLAFTPAGQRLGRGGGYYDGLLTRTRARSAGLAYAFQMLDQLPESPSDRRLDLILTESASYSAPFQPASSARIAQGGTPGCC